MVCQHCGGLGYTVENTGIVSLHFPYIEETHKEPCNHCNRTKQIMKENGLLSACTCEEHECCPDCSPDEN
ncbi:hypothetical protein C0R09_18440 [Brevibacillus laterosporus]|uniref:hypothetical protein n=1 Tax=Brevibacillus laterosporus TaxID=1465 RepID=UPI000C78E6BB|nr:hypothetical protein [Brevibacillus laterosporus]AUM66337.1 hypothetical protein C0R09_18440 [Brevibacillus laterosporus]